MSDGLGGQVAIVTGGGRGIGRGVAQTLASEGAAVAIVSRTKEQLDETVALIEGVGGRAVAFVADVRDRDRVAEVVSETERQLGPVTLLVNDAGTGGPVGPDWEVDAEAWWECVEAKVRGAFLFSQAVLPGMRERRAGRIVNMASITGLGCFPYVTATSVAQSALIRHAEGLAAAAAEFGVQAFAVHPGIVRTALLDGYLDSPEGERYLSEWRALPEDAFSPPEVCGALVVGIAQGKFDRLSGCFIDATVDLEGLSAWDGPLDDQLRLRLVPLV